MSFYRSLPRAAVFACVGALLGIGSAKAADYSANSYDWSGVYIGAYAGAGAIVDEINVPSAGLNFNGVGGEGWLGGVMAGYNWQTGSNLLIGVQGEVGFNHLATTADIPGLFNLDAKQELVANLAARLGLLITPETLGYVIGGYSYSHYDVHLNAGGTPISADENFNGFLVGAGIETVLAPGITGRIEYRYTQYGGEDWGTGGALKVSPSTHTGTIGIAWNFGGGGHSHATPAADYLVAAPNRWTGFYVGANAGAGAVVDEIEVPPLGLDLNGIGGEGLLGGILAGYNWQMNTMVVGVEAGVGYDNLETQARITGLGSISAKQGLVYSASLRIGTLLSPETLAYAIGGYSHSDYEVHVSGLGSFDQDYNGFHIGAGLETALSQNLTGRIEYRYTSYSGEGWNTGGTLDVSPSTHTGTIGIAWHF